jgi:hypothetical protein
MPCCNFTVNALQDESCLTAFTLGKPAANGAKQPAPRYGYTELVTIAPGGHLGPGRQHGCGSLSQPTPPCSGARAPAPAPWRVPECDRRFTNAQAFTHYRYADGSGVAPKDQNPSSVGAD